MWIRINKYIYVNCIHIWSYMCLVDTCSKYVHMIYVSIYIYIYTIHFNRETNPPKNSWNHPPLPSAINPCVFVSVESKVLIPTCHPNQLPAIHRFLFPHRWSTLPLHQGPGGKKTAGFFHFRVIGPEEQNWRHEGFFEKKTPAGSSTSSPFSPAVVSLTWKKGVANEPLTEAFFLSRALSGFGTTVGTCYSRVGSVFSRSDRWKNSARKRSTASCGCYETS